MNDTLKVAGRIGAELGAAKAEVERLSGLLRDVNDVFEGQHPAPGLVIARVRNTLSQHAEPTDTYTAVDMATAAAQAFRDGQAAVEQAAAQDEREAEGVEVVGHLLVDAVGGNAIDISLNDIVDCQRRYGGEIVGVMTVVQHQNILSAVTAARDDLHAELLREIEKTCQLGMDCNGLKAELRDMTAERDRLRGEVFGLRISLKDSDAGLVHFVNRRDQLGMEVDKLRAEVEMLREDAERWRYVSLQGDDMHWLNLLRVDLDDFGGNINAAVDALIDGEAPAMAAKEA